jgi:hypothetical protein
VSRIAYVLMTYDVILSAAMDTGEATSNMPLDATVSHIVLLDTSQQARVYFTSKELAEVPEGGLIPEYPVIVERA